MADKKISDLDAIATGDVLATAVFEIQNVGGAVPESRKLTKVQMASLLGGGGGGKRVPFVYNLSGAHTVSAGVTNIDVEALGAGGGGSNDGGNTAGGGGGAYAAAYAVTVAEGDSLTVTVGTAGASNDAGAGAAGGSSLVADALMTTIVEAVGGGGGDATVGPGSGGQASASTGDIAFDGRCGTLTAADHSNGGDSANGWGPGQLMDITHGGYGYQDAGVGGGAGMESGGSGPNSRAGAGLIIVWEYQS